MGERMYRARILLEPAQQRALAELARREGRSVSDLVREMIQRQLDQRRHEEDAIRRRRLAAVEQIRRHCQAILERRGGAPLDVDVVEMIDRLREERDGQILGASAT